jgi:hypothetical protein
MKVTVYWTSEFMGNVVKAEGTLIGYGRMKYAQYDDAPFVDFIPRGKRKAIRVLKTYKPYLLVIEGWCGPDPDPMCPPEGGMSKYSSFNPRWKSDFDREVNERLNVVADFREGSEYEKAVLETEF